MQQPRDSKATQWMSSAKRKAVAVAAVIGFAAAGSVLAAGTASADPWNPNVDVAGRAFVCGPRSFPLGIHYDGNTGDRGFVPVRRDGSFLVSLHRVGPRGEFVRGTVDCAWRPPAGFGVVVNRPARGGTFWHTI